MKDAFLAVFYFFPVKIRDYAFDAFFKDGNAAGVIVMDIAGQNYIAVGVNIYHSPWFAFPIFLFSHHFEVTD